MDPSVFSSLLPQPSGEPRRRLSASEAAALLGVTVDTVRKWVIDGLLPARRLGPGRRIVIDPDDLERLFTSEGPRGGVKTLGAE